MRVAAPQTIISFLARLRLTMSRAVRALDNAPLRKPISSHAMAERDDGGHRTMRPPEMCAGPARARVSPMTSAIADPISATVTLRGVTVEVDSDIGQAFATDCVRFVEGIVTEEQLRKKYDLDDANWRQLASHDALQRAVGATKERRIRSGQAAQEKAAHLFVSCPDVLGGIVNDAGAPPRSRIEAIRELRQVATAGSGANTPADDREKFVIRINFGTQKVVREIELKPAKPEQEPLASALEHEDNEHEYERDF
jgi:hypothetical protein